MREAITPSGIAEQVDEKTSRTVSIGIRYSAIATDFG